MAGSARWAQPTGPGPRLTCLVANCGTGQCANLDPCTACVVAQCNNSSQACHSSAECFVLTGGVGDCAGVVTCVDNCMATYPGGVPEYNRFSVCAIQKCESSC